MAPSTLHVSTQLLQVIWYHLDSLQCENALFFAGRLHATDPKNSWSINILSQCHLRCGETKLAYDCTRLIATRGTHLGCAYAHAQACLKLGRNVEGIKVLERVRNLWEGKINHLGRGVDPRLHPYYQRLQPDTAAIQCLLGKLLQANQEYQRAVEHYSEALKLNPFMWDAFERACGIGHEMRTDVIFRQRDDLLSATADVVRHCDSDAKSSTTIRQTNESASNGPNVPPSDPFVSSKNSNIERSTGLAAANVSSRMNMGAKPDLTQGEDSIDTPTGRAQFMKGESLGLDRAYDDTDQSVEPPNAPVRRLRAPGSNDSYNSHESVRSGFVSRTNSRSTSDQQSDISAASRSAPAMNQPNKRQVSGTLHQPTEAEVPGAPQRRSNRLYTKRAPGPAFGPGITDQEHKRVKATGTKGRIAMTANTRVPSMNRKPGDSSLGSLKESRTISTSQVPVMSSLHASKVYDSPHKEAEARAWILDLLAKLGGAYYALSRYRCKQAIQQFQSLSPAQRDTSWVLAKIGKAQYEDGQFAEAKKTFARVRKLSPSRIRDMDIYSTALWHLKQEVELIHLCHDLYQVDRLAPETWCSIGNAFSAQKQRNDALKCFKRATQLDPRFAYGFTLQGHEYLELEEYQKAESAYRLAIAVDPSHYNGFFGLGRVLMKLEQDNVAAENAFRAATNIHPHNSTLHLYLGQILEKQRLHQQAAQAYTRSCELNPTLSTARYRKARVLMSIGDIRGALNDLNILKDVCADASMVHFLLGKVLQKLGDSKGALKHFTITMTLDPKSTPHIREVMEEGMESMDDSSMNGGDIEMSG